MDVGLFKAIYEEDVAAVLDDMVNGSPDVNGLDANGYTPLTLAFELSADAIAEALIDHGADLHLANGYGCTPLTSAIVGKNATWARILVDAGVALDARGIAEGHLTSPVHEACYWGMTDLLTAMLKRYGARLMNLKAHRGMTPREFARKNPSLLPADLAALDVVLASVDATSPAPLPPTRTHHVCIDLSKLDDKQKEANAWTQEFHVCARRRQWPQAILAAEMSPDVGEDLRARVHRMRMAHHNATNRTYP